MPRHDDCLTFVIAENANKKFMKKHYIIAALALVGICGPVQATIINAPGSLVGANVLDGQNAYSWGIAVTVPTGQQIDSATLTFSNVKLTAANSSGTGYLYTDLLNLNKSGVTTYTDNDAAGDYFSGKYSSLNLGTKFFASVGTTLSWTYVFTSSQLVALNAYLTAGGFSIGIDPDCHYDVGGLSFTYTTSTIPTSHNNVPDAATTASLLVVSLLGLEVLRRKFMPVVQS
jgi:hypothetical protein